MTVSLNALLEAEVSSLFLPPPTAHLVEESLRSRNETNGDVFFIGIILLIN